MGYGKTSQKNQNSQGVKPPKPIISGSATTITSLLDHMKPGREYESIITLFNPSGPKPTISINIGLELRKGISAISEIRKRPLICYIANVTNPTLGGSRSIESIDDLPFSEMVASVPSECKEVDVLIVTPGGSGIL